MERIINLIHRFKLEQMKTPGSVVSEPFVPKVIHKNKLKIPKNQEWKVPIMRK